MMNDISIKNINEGGNKGVSCFVGIVFMIAQIFPLYPIEVRAQKALDLPVVGVMIRPSHQFIPPLLKGMKVDLDQPFEFDFILDSGNLELGEEALREESGKLIRYFLASLTIPEDDLWVNLSPWEKNRIIPFEFGLTEMGRDLLAQDYILKQLTASLMYPEAELGEEFWDKIYARAKHLYKISEIPVNTFNKVWIVPETAVIYEKKDMAFVLESHLKVMLESDYLALNKSLQKEVRGDGPAKAQEAKKLSRVSAEVIREVIVPEIEKEINTGENFAKLRQVYHSLILAKWYKERLKSSLLNQSYADQKKVKGVDLSDRTFKEKIYQQYMESFKKGVFNYIKEDYDSISQEIIPRKYFSGGLALKVPLTINENLTPQQLSELDDIGKLSWIEGIYRQPRASPGSVNAFIKKQFEKNNVGAGESILLEDGSRRKTYYVDDLLNEMGQLGHIGFIEKDENGNPIEGGLEVIFLDSKHAQEEVLRAHEGFKVSRWVEKRAMLGLSPNEMRKWLKEHLSESIEFLKEVDRQAEEKYPVEPIYAQAQKAGELPSNEKIAQTYQRKKDFQDLNLAAGRWGVASKVEGIMPRAAVYAIDSEGEDFDDILIRETAKQQGVEVDAIEKDFDREITMIESKIRHNGFIEPKEDIIVEQIHSIFDRLIEVYQKHTQESPGDFHLADGNTVNAFVLRKRPDVYFYKGLYETLYDISIRLNIPLTEGIIAFIIAHELGHALQHTSHEGIEIGDFNKSASPALIAMIQNAEYDADLNGGLLLMDEAGFSVLEALDAMVLLEFITNSSQADSVLSSHPYLTLRKHRLSGVILDQKTNVFKNVNAPRVLMKGNGRIKSWDIDFRHLMDKSEEELSEMAKETTSLTELDELAGMVAMGKRINALKGLVKENQLKTSFLRYLYIRAVMDAMITPATERSVMLNDIDYSDMKKAAAIYDFSSEEINESILTDSAKDFEDMTEEELLEIINRTLGSYREEAVIAAREQLQKVLPLITEKAKELDFDDFKDFLLPREEVKDLIRIFKVRKEVGIKGFSYREEKKEVDYDLVNRGIEDPKRFISAFFYANYLGQEASLEVDVPTTDLKVKVQRKSNHLYLSNPAYRSISDAQERSKLADIALLHYILKQSGVDMFSSQFAYKFPGSAKFLELDPKIISEFFMKYYTLLLKKYPEPIAIILAKERMKEYLKSEIDPTKDFQDIEAIIKGSNTVEGFMRELSQERQKAQAEYTGESNDEDLSDYLYQRSGDFIDDHPLIIFAGEAIRKYQDQLPFRLIEDWEGVLEEIIRNGPSIMPEMDIMDILVDIAHAFLQEIRREVHVSEVFLQETELDYYQREKSALSFESLSKMNDWEVSEYLRGRNYNINNLINEALDAGVSINDIFVFMQTHLTYASRRETFKKLFLGRDTRFAGYLLRFFDATFRDDPQEIIVWFLGMFSQKDALELLDQFTRDVLYKKAKETENNLDAVKFQNLTITLIEYIYSQTSKTFHVDDRSVKVYLDLIYERMQASGRADDEGYIHQMVHGALMNLSPAVNFNIELTSPSEISEDGSPDFKTKKTNLVPEEFIDSSTNYNSNFMLHNFGWNDNYSSQQSVFVTFLTELSLRELQELLRERLKYIDSQVDVEYRGEVFALGSINDFFSNLITLIILKKLHNPEWDKSKDRIERLDELIRINVGYRREGGEITLDFLGAVQKLQINQDEINSILSEAITENLHGTAIPSGHLDTVWESYVQHHHLEGNFAQMVSFFQDPNVGHDIIQDPISFLKDDTWGNRHSYRQIAKKFFLKSSSYSRIFNAYIKSHGRGYAYGKYKPLDERLAWIKQVLPNKSIIKDGILDLWEIDLFPEVIADLPKLVEMARYSSEYVGELNDISELLGEMDDDVGRLQKLNDEIFLPKERIHELLDFYVTIIPLTLSPQKISRYGATAYMLWQQLPENIGLDLSSHLEALEKFMPEPSVLRDELLMKLATKHVRKLDEIPLITGKLYSNNLLSRDKDVRTQDFVTETLLHIFGVAKIEERREILAWILGSTKREPEFVESIERQYNISFTTLPDDVKLLPVTIREKFLEGFMLGDNGLLDPQNDAGRAVMSNFLEELFVDIFPERTKGIDDEARGLLSKVFIIVMNSFPPYRRVQIIKALAALRLRSDFQKTSTGQRMAVLLGALGPVGIKVAQYLSENETLVPDEDIRSSLGALRHKAPEITMISLASVLENEIPLAEILVRQIIGKPVGVASIKQVNPGEWLEIELLAEELIKVVPEERDEFREKMNALHQEELSFEDVASYLIEKAEHHGIDLQKATIEAVFKILRPNLQTTIGMDFDALDEVSTQLQGTSYHGELLNLSDLVETVKGWINLESKFTNEVKFHIMLSKLDYSWAEGLEKQAGVKIKNPRILYATDSVIVEEKIKGVPILDLAEKQSPVTMADVLDAGYKTVEARDVLRKLSNVDLRAAHITLSLKKSGFAEKDLPQLTKKLLKYDYGKLRGLLRQVLLHQIFVDRTFHADLHQGNILITPEGDIVMIDRGNVGRLNSKQVEGGKFLLRGLLLRDKGIIKRGIDRIFLNANFPHGQQAQSSQITEEDIQETLDKGHDLKMTMNIISMKAVKGTKNTPGGKSFSTLLKTLTQAMWLFPIDQRDGIYSLEAMAEYISMSEGDTIQALEQQAKYFVKASEDSGETQGQEGDILAITKRIFHKKTDGFFLASLWQPRAWKALQAPIKILESRMPDFKSSNLMALYRTHGRQVLEKNIHELVQRQDLRIGDALRDIISVPLAEKFLTDYIENELEKRSWGKLRIAIGMRLVKMILVLRRPLTRMNVEAAEEWFDVIGRHYIESVIPEMTVKQAIGLADQFFKGSFTDIKDKFDEESGKNFPKSAPRVVSQGEDETQPLNLSSDDSNRKGEDDYAMVIGEKNSQNQANKGGIDFNPNLLELQIQGEGLDLNLPISPGSPQEINIEGLLPIIINITPIFNLPTILGEAENKPTSQKSKRS